MKPVSFVFIDFLIIGTFATDIVFERQRFDGWYNNLANIEWGSTGEHYINKVPTVYDDGTYQATFAGRPNARHVSNALFNCTSPTEYSPNRTALFAFFSQMVSMEISDSSQPTCPPEVINVPLKNDPKLGDDNMPFERARYDKKTGQSLNNPRKQVNSATSWIDGSFIYGSSEVWANVLRSFVNGTLVTLPDNPQYPGINKPGLPFQNIPNPLKNEYQDTDKLYMFGDVHAHQNPAIFSLATLWFRLHNHVALQLNDNLTDEERFYTARKKVIAIYQNIIINEWLPVAINEKLPPYEKYVNNIQPDISTTFETAAMKFWKTLVPPAIYVRNPMTCDEVNKTLRLCNSYGISQTLFKEKKIEVEQVLAGLASQKAEKEDTCIVEDFRDSYFGPLHDSRVDAIAFTLMSGRDFGLADYQTVRTTWCGEEQPVFNVTESHPNLVGAFDVLYPNMSSVDVFTGGMMETRNGHFCKLFTDVLKEQFIRLRNADRFWFENKQNGLFTDSEIAEIKTYTLSKVMSDVMGIRKISSNVFYHTPGDPCTAKTFSVDELNKHVELRCTSRRNYDYFVTSEFSYIASIVALIIFPFVCILVAYITNKINKQALSKSKRKYDQEKLRQMVNEKAKKSIDAGSPVMDFVVRTQRRKSVCLETTDKRLKISSHFATEWLGIGENTRTVEIRLESEDNLVLLVNSPSGKLYRELSFRNTDTVLIGINGDAKRTTLLLYVPKEYDLVIEFSSYELRQEFLTILKEFLEKSGKQVTCHMGSRKSLHKQANTKIKRQMLLEKFFKSVFAEIETYDEEVDGIFTLSEGREKAREIMDCELSKAEFAESLSLKPDSSFVELMFDLLDKDKNGYISFRELLYAVALFSKGSEESRLQLLFKMYDRDNDGSLGKGELKGLLKSLTEMANTNMGVEETNKIIDSWYEAAGVDPSRAINFEGFQKLMSGHMQSMRLDWKGLKKEVKTRPPTKRDRRIGSSSSSSTSSVTKRGPREPANKPNDDIAVQSTVRVSGIREKYNPVRAKLNWFLHFIENHKQHIFYLVLFYGICIGLFADKFYHYAVETEHTGVRRLTGYGVSFSRGGANALGFCYGLILLTMCRNMITWLRETFLNLYVPFDSSVAFHKNVAWTGLFFTVIHVVGHLFNFYHLSTQPISHLCMFNEMYFKSNFLPNFAFWLYETITGITGLLATLVMITIYIFATQTSRQYIFAAFWITHKLIIPWYILLLLHGSGRLLQPPGFYIYFVGPAVLFTIDKLISISRKNIEISVIKAELLPSDINCIEFKRPSNFEYKSGQWVRIACLSQGKNEYHPFTLTSAPHEDTLLLHIRSVGPWTWNLRYLFDTENLNGKPYPKLLLDGPYGSGHQDWYKYDISVLVGGGIGVTPYASILKDFVHLSSINSMYRMKCQKLYFIWVTNSHRHFEWLIDILRQVEEVDVHNVVSTHIFITQFFEKFDLRTTMLYICEEHFTKISGKSLFTGLTAKTHFGRPEFETFFRSVHEKYPKVKKIGVFSCGPPGLTKNVEKSCLNSNKMTNKTSFEHHYENF